MQAEDNGYYLKLDENGEYAMWGCYYAHCENEIGGRDKPVSYTHQMCIRDSTSASLPTKKRILTVCVKLFLEKGYKQTTLAEINEKALSLIHI